jgi:apolipoprotein D and lipocalin family protein
METQSQLKSLGMVFQKLVKILCITFLAIGGINSTLFAKSKFCTSPVPVEQVDVERYLGKWYEIARIPQIFQPFCTKVTADYGLNENGTIEVVNRCRVADPVFGLPISVRGEASAVDATNSQLKVKFFGGLAVGDYWILELDPDYGWALVGDPYRLTLYILSRQPTLDESIISNLYSLAETKHGYNTSRLMRTRQD